MTIRSSCGPNVTSTRSAVRPLAYTVSSTLWEDWNHWCRYFSGWGGAAAGARAGSEAAAAGAADGADAEGAPGSGMAFSCRFPSLCVVTSGEGEDIDVAGLARGTDAAEDGPAGSAEKLSISSAKVVMASSQLHDIPACTSSQEG